MKTHLPSFKKMFSRKNWGGIWSLDGLYLNNEQAHIFVERAIETGYEYDEDVPESLIREWLNLREKGDDK